MITQYIISRKQVEELENERSLKHKKVFKTNERSTPWHIIVFKPGQDYFLASPGLCVCDQCIREYGSCDMFSRYQVDAHEVCDMPLLSDDSSHHLRLWRMKVLTVS